MRELNVIEIERAVEDAVIKANTVLPLDIKHAIERAAKTESSASARRLLEIVLENAEMADTESMAICQDTGMVVVEIELGQEIHFTGGLLEDAVNQGVRQGYKRGYFRNSVVSHPFNRVNTGDNTPAIIHLKMVDGDKIKLNILPKGAGSENMGQLAMLKPAHGLNGVKEFVLRVIKEASGNPCPPVIVGVGVGGNMEKAAMMAKEALMRDIDLRNPDPELAAQEEEILHKINQLGIGPQGLGGDTTALAVNIEVFPTHIACLPVAVCLGCHATRRITVEI